MNVQERQTDKIRLQFDFAPEAYRDLEQIQEELGAPSRAETVRYALRTLQWLISVTKHGDATFLVKRKNEPLREVIFPFIKSSWAEIVPAKAPRQKPKIAALQHSE